jgi:penicillin-binding protein 1C
VPKNFDQGWHGTVSVRIALAQSLNIPAVKVLDAVGPAKLHGRLQQVGLTPVLPKGAEPSLALALGGLGLKLSDLAALYAGLARGGEPIALTHRRGAVGAKAPPSSTRLLAPVAAWYVTDILRHAPAPANAKPGQIAYKTGTSYGFRDAWAIGYDGRHTIAVWVGRPDGDATPGLAGRVAAAPILFDAFAADARRAPLPRPQAPCSSQALTCRRPSSAFGSGPKRRVRRFLEPVVQIAFRPTGPNRVDDGEAGSVVVKAEGGARLTSWSTRCDRVGSRQARKAEL